AGAALLAPGPDAPAAPVPPGTPEDVSVPPGAAHVLPAGTGNVAARGKPGPRGRTAPAPRVEFRYSAPEVADAGDTVTWKWTIRNRGTDPVDKVVLDHRLTPRLKTEKVTTPCKPVQRTIRCDYGALRPGQVKKGALTAKIPANASGSVQIHGRVTWQLAKKAVAPDKPMDPGKPAPETKPENDTKPTTDSKPAQDSKPTTDSKPADTGKPAQDDSSAKPPA
ncbi:hypothetical protein, partial [Actinomadura yumaensis]